MEQIVCTCGIKSLFNENTDFFAYSLSCLQAHIHRIFDEKDDDRFSAFLYEPANIRFWIITENDNSVTTILLPEEY